jgi:hypothetical protein
MPKKKITVVHFYPLEYFPPVTNLLDYFTLKSSDISITAYSTYNDKNRKEYKNKKMKLRRYALPKIKDHKLIRGLKYVSFYFGSLFHLILEKPDSIIYYESISSWPVYIYVKYFNKKCKIFIHYHEYASPAWYSKYMKLVRYFHRLERKYLYSKATWISQTNEVRLKMFNKDNEKINDNKLMVLPNYPPKKWISANNFKQQSQKTRIVYIGSLSFEGSYILEFCNWVNNQEDIIFDIYSYNLHDDVRSFIQQLKSDNINLYTEGVDYQDIPQLLSKYDIGVILHKAYNSNYKYNATNKLFEYLICNLDVWFSEELMGCQDYATKNTWPIVSSINFDTLEKVKFTSNNDRSHLVYEPKHFFCEDAYNKLLKSIKA